MLEKIEGILTKVLPDTCYIRVVEYKNRFTGMQEIIIDFSASAYEINGVQGQRPHRCNLCLELDTMELKTANYGGMGERSVYRRPNLEDKNERFLAMKGIRVPFRKPSANQESVLKAIQKFAENWVKIITENLETIKYKEYVDYSKFK